jgi:hypothetical protein
MRSWRRCADYPTDQSWGAAWSAGGKLLTVGGAHFDVGADSYVFDDRVFSLSE